MADKDANAGADDSADKNSDNGDAETGKISQNKDDQKSKDAKKSGKKSDDKSNDNSDDKTEPYKAFDSKEDYNDHINKIVKARLAREKNKTDDSDDNGDAKKAETENRSDNSKAFNSFMSGLGDISYSKGIKLWRMYKDDLELDENDKPLNFTEVLKEIKKEFPDWFKAKVSGDADAGKGNNSVGNDAADMNSLIRKKAGRL